MCENRKRGENYLEEVTGLGFEDGVEFIREMQVIKTTTRYHSPTTRKAKTKRADNNKWWLDMEKVGP